MTAVLRRLFPADLAGRAATLSLVANLGLMVLKLSVGVITGSVAVLSDGVDSAQDALAAAIALVSVRFGSRPPDLSHPYGHGRAETVAATLQALFIAVGGAFIIFRAVDRLIDPPSSIGTSLGLVAMAITAGVNLVVGRYATRVARITGSPAIASDARHLWTNVVQAAAVLLGLALVALTGELAFDAIAALALGVYLGWTATAILLAAVGDVLDKSLSEEEVHFVEEAILAERGEIAGYHRLRTRRSGQRRNVDFHLILPPALTVAEAHVITDRIEGRIQSRWPGSAVTIHIEPSDGRFRGPMDVRAPSRGREGEEAEGPLRRRL